MKNNILIIIPTYNAKGGITQLINKILITVKSSRILIVDDNSPDGTSKLIENHFRNNSRIKLIVRNKKGGRGSAVIRGFKEGLKDKNIEYFIEMDADLCHDPKYIPKLVAACSNADVSIASRYHKSSKNINWKLKRRLLSILVSSLLKLLLKIPINEYTNGFRCYKRQVLESINFNKIQSKGFVVLTEVAYHIHKKGFKFKEIPITFHLYQINKSNLNTREIKEGLTLLKRIITKDLKLS